MRRAAKIDANPPAIVEAFREMGCDVLHTHQLGQGAPDLVVTYSGISILVECKGDKGKLTEAQERLYSTLRTKPRIVRDVTEAWDCVEVLRGWHRAICSTMNNG